MSPQRDNGPTEHTLPPTSRLGVVGRARKAFSFPILLGGLLVAGLFFPVAQASFVEGDTWWHLTVGEHILMTGRWPTSDPYSFTVLGHDWIAYEWLGDVALALAMRLGGLPGLAGLLLVLSSALTLLLYYWAYLRSGNAKAAFVASALVLPLTVLFFIIRPQLLGYIFLAGTLICLERFRQGRQKSLWLLPALFLLWVNTHGSFVVGLLALGLYWVGALVHFSHRGVRAEPWSPSQRRHLAVILLLCLVVLPLTPYGSRLAAYPLELVFLQPLNLSTVPEWHSAASHPLLWKLLLLFMLLFVVAGVVFRPTYRLEELAFLVLATYASWAHRRFAIVFAIMLVPLLAAALARGLSTYEAAKDRYALNAAMLALVVVGLVVGFPSEENLEQMVARSFPRGAVAYLRQHPMAGRMFNDSDWGGYLTWSLGPQHKVFIDGRADIYEYAGVLSDYLSIVRVEANTLPLLQKYGVEACLIRRGSPLSQFLAGLPDWELVYQDDVSALFVRRYLGRGDS